MNKVVICGVPYKIVYDDVIDEECEGIVQGKILYSKCEIHIKKGLQPELEKEVLIHEMVHGILVHLGKSDMSGNEELVQLLAHGIYEHFNIKGE